MRGVFPSIVFSFFFIIFIGLSPQKCLGQKVLISITDISDLQGISDAEVLIFNEEKKEIFKGKTDRNGIVDPLLELPPSGFIEIHHPAYLLYKSSLQDARQQGFHFFLESKTFDLEQVVFTANKHKEKKEDVPYQIKVISAKQIAFFNPPTSADLLAQQGIFVQKSQLGGGSPNLRGFEANKVLLVVDGVRMNNAIYRSGHLQNVLTIDPNMIERTEVLLGPGSIIYGSDALGGVMHFYTRDPILGSSKKPTIKTNVFGRYASAAEERTLHADINVGFEKWGFITSLSTHDFGDLRIGANRSVDFPDFGTLPIYPAFQAGRDTSMQNVDVNVLPGAGYTQYDFLQKFLFVPNEKQSHTFNFQYSSSSNVPRFDRLSQVQNGIPRFGQWDYGPQERLMAHYRFKWVRENLFFDQLSLVAAFQQIEESRISRIFGDDWQNNRIENVNVFSLNIDAVKSFKNKQELSYGVETIKNIVASDAFRQNIQNQKVLRLDTRYPDGGSDMHFAAIYASHKWHAQDQLTLTAGMRLSKIDLHAVFLDKQFFPLPVNEIQQDALALSGKLGMVYNGKNGFRLSTILSTGFRAPNLDDVTKVFDSQPGNVVVPNPDLQPEYTYNGEVQFSKTWDNSLFLSATGFFTYYDNAIVVRDFYLDGQDSVYYDGVLSNVQANVNAQKAYIAGFSTEQMLDLGKISLEHNLTFTFGQVLMEDVPLDHIPPLFGKFSLNYSVKQLQVSSFVHYQGWKRLNRYSPRDFNNLDFATPEGSPAWWTLNLKVSFALNPKMSIQAGVENILDRHYRPFSSRISAPGRNFILSLRTTF